MPIVDQLPEIIGDPGPSIPLISGDTSSFLPVAITHKDGDSTGKRAKTVVLYIETADIRFALGASPDPTLPFGYPVSKDQWLVLTKWSEISIFEHIRNFIY